MLNEELAEKKPANKNIERMLIEKLAEKKPATESIEKMLMRNSAGRIPANVLGKYDPKESYRKIEKL